MKRFILLPLLFCICVTFCACGNDVRNDLERLSEHSWIEPGQNLFVIEAKDEDNTESSEAEIEASDLEQEAIPVFSDLNTTAAELDAIVTPYPIPDTNAETDLSGSASDSDTIDIISDENPSPEITDKTADTVSETYAASDEQEAYVWIPKSGKKYHSKAECSNMSAPSKVTVAEAEALGFTKCKRCY